MKRLLFLSLLLVASTLEMFAQKVCLKSGKPVPVRLIQSVSSRYNTRTVRAIVDLDIRDDSGEKILIRKGTPVEVGVSAMRARGVGKAGYIDLTCLSTTTVDGQYVALSGGIYSYGQDREGAVLGCGLGLGLTFLFPVGLLLLCIRGENVNIPNNTVIADVYTNGSYMVNAE